MTGEGRRRLVRMLALGLGTFALLFVLDAVLLRPERDPSDPHESCPWDVGLHAEAGVTCDACHDLGEKDLAPDVARCGDCHDEPPTELFERMRAADPPR